MSKCDYPGCGEKLAWEDKECPRCELAFCPIHEYGTHHGCGGSIYSHEAMDESPLDMV